jgi:catechol 2,3-dioxygenase-like lactoylglutathione lyase family enzyme
MLKEFFAICLLVNDFEKSLNFYTNILGLEINSTGTKFTDFKMNGANLAIFEKNEAISMFDKKHMNTGGSIVLAFQVNNLDDKCKKLKSKGVDIFDGPKITEWGQKVAYFKDLDENIWEMSEN